MLPNGNTGHERVIKWRHLRHLFLVAVVFSIIYIYKVALHEYWPMSSGDALISSWPTLVWRGHRPQEGGGCVRA
jgi:hypothetical protein